MKIRLFQQHPGEHDLPIQADMRLAAQAAGAAAVEQVCFTAHSAVALQSFKLAPDTVLTGANTNSVTLSVNQYRAGALLQTLLSVPFTAGVNAPALTQSDLATLVNGAILAAGRTLAKGDVLTVKLAQVGAGLAFPAAKFEIDYSVAGTPGR